MEVGDAPHALIQSAYSCMTALVSVDITAHPRVASVVEGEL